MPDAALKKTWWGAHRICSAANFVDPQASTPGRWSPGELQPVLMRSMRARCNCSQLSGLCTAMYLAIRPSASETQLGCSSQLASNSWKLTGSCGSKYVARSRPASGIEVARDAEARPSKCKIIFNGKPPSLRKACKNRELTRRIQVRKLVIRNLSQNSDAFAHKAHGRELLLYELGSRSELAHEDNRRKLIFQTGTEVVRCTAYEDLIFSTLDCPDIHNKIPRP